MSPLSLADIPVGSSARIRSILTIGPNRRRLLDLGLIPGSRIEVIRRSPAGNPIAYLIKGTVIALRNEDAGQILVENNYPKSIRSKVAPSDKRLYPQSQEQKTTF
jgi:ferrous iron transport protein A